VELPENDIKFFELNKFIKLVVDQNPNVVELLWTSGPDIIMSSPAYELLRQARGNLLTSKVAFATSGYAFSQLSRMKNSKKNVNSLEPLNDLCSLLKRAVEDGNIDKNFIEEHCGNNVLNYMLENKYLV
jgi:predicted nucleotidyltransferase